MLLTSIFFLFSKCFNTIKNKNYHFKNSITCIKRPPKGSYKGGLLQQVVFKCRFYKVDLRKVVVSEHWSLKPSPNVKF